MMYTKIISTVVVAAALLALPACKKKTETPAPQPPAKPVCRISTVTGGSFGLSLSYNNDKRIKTIISNSGTISYTYAGNMVYRVYSDPGGTVTGRMEITNNSAGFPVKVKQFDASNALTTTTEITYDANNQALSREDIPAGGGSPSTTTYTWTNGNLTAVNATSTNYAYYTDKPSQQGDYLQLLQLLDIGFIYIKNANMVKNIGSSNDIVYTYNSDDYVTSLTAGATVLNYTYICD